MRIRVIKYQIKYDPVNSGLHRADWILLEEKDFFHEITENYFFFYLLKNTVDAQISFDRFREEGCYINSYVENDDVKNDKMYLDISLDLENLTGIEIMRTRLSCLSFHQFHTLDVIDRVIKIRGEIISRERNFKIQQLFGGNCEEKSN